MSVRSQQTIKKHILTAILCVYCLLCVILGGAGREGFVLHGWLQAFAAVGTAALVLTWPGDLELKVLRIPIVILFGLILLCLIQLIPMPVEIWGQFPSRQILIDGYADLGIDAPALPLSLDADATMASIGYVFTPLFILLLCARIGIESLSFFAPLLICAIALLSASLGVLQLIGGSESALYFYDFTSRSMPVGFFSNVNHQASLLLTAIPFSIYLTSRFRDLSQSNDNRAAFLIFGVAVTGFLIALLIGARSVSGYLLLLPVIMLSVFGLQRSNGMTKVIASIAVGTILIFAVSTNSLASLLIDISETDFAKSDVSRYNIWQITLHAIEDHWLFGTGIGTYESVIPFYENPDSVTATWVAKAHNDFLQVFMEGGIVGVVLLLLGVFWFVRTAFPYWRETSSRKSRTVKRFASIALVVWLLHSLVDYPGRTPAMASVLALCVACLGVTADMKRRIPPVPMRPVMQNKKRLKL